MSALRGPFVAQHVFVLAALVSLMNAIAQTKDEPSVTVKVTPAKIPPGGSVAISGLGYAPSGAQILITVTTPGGANTKLTAVPDTQSRYSTLYLGAKDPGTYSVGVQAGVKGAPATTQFTVESSVIDIDEDVADNKKFLEKAQDLVKSVRTQVDSVPDSPAKTEMQGKLERLEPTLAKLTQQATQLSSMLQPFKTLMAQHPETQPALQPMLDHLAELDQKITEESQTISEITAQSKKTLKGCDTIDQSTQSLKALSEVLDHAHDPVEFTTGYASSLAKSWLPGSGDAAAQAASAANLASGIHSAGESQKGLEEAMNSAKGAIVENGIELGAETAIAEKLVKAFPQSARNGDGYKLAVAEVKKFAPRVIGDGGNLVTQFVNAAALVTDVATYSNQGFFARYCQKFEGSFSATMKAYFYAKGYEHDDWWHYSTTIKGKLTLRYPKDASGTVALSGQFEGGATQFTYDESVWTHSDLFKIVEGGLLGHKDIAPLPMDSGQGGVLASLTSPTSFYIPVSGQYANGRVSFHLEDARSDFVDSYVKGHTFYVVMSRYTLGVPMTMHFSLPYQNAHFILNHFAFDYPTTQTKDSIVIEKKDVQDRPRPGNEAYYNLDLKVCNPGCG